MIHLQIEIEISSEISIESFQNRQKIEESERIDKSSSSKSITLTICSKRHTNQPISVEISNITADDEILNISSEDEMEEIEEISIESEEESADKFFNIFEDYSSPNYDPDESIEIGNSEFDTFSNLIYMTKKELELRDDFYFFSTCPKCYKLYNKQEVKDYKENDTNSVMKFPTIDRFKLKFKLVYPFAGIQQQLIVFYNYIYNSQIWKSFKETNNENSLNFFRNETVDLHLGLIINFDWFQPYDGTIHSTGRKNLLILGLLLGSNEISLHKINHYLAPIVDELKSLWNGIILNKTDNCSNRKKIWVALILVSCDVLATKKIYGHISALVSCYRCEKKANYKNLQHNFAGMDNIDNWFIVLSSSKAEQGSEG
ncbi:hypothetical protein Glove_95g4 [Diversispora epigaea]|uniref:Transposase domain-containing protein n=1 Tax=Diversispora epigaea TaxID=1348612 RepID=A0A397JEJ0_9GLOM|nr:hypothetical protein Glove_95g4 [Diversispora epigaea]